MTAYSVNCYLIIKNADASLVEIESRDINEYCFFYAPTGAI